ncbi:MAG TPA: hypothetical protein DEO60_14155 [Bacteroidales bacterium]|nr:hypothetical protein [Bacteroidales bacterium]HBZ22272.1 hypothetical protein [Bacteroidales bacterium]
MKKLYVITLLLLLICCLSCKKTPFSPEGPTDVRIRNLTGSVLTETLVRIKEEEIPFGTIDINNTTGYHRFRTAFSKAYISARMNGDTISTGPVDFTYMNYFGQVKMTYDVNLENNRLTIKNVTLDSPL